MRIGLKSDGYNKIAFIILTHSKQKSHAREQLPPLPNDI